MSRLKRILLVGIAYMAVMSLSIGGTVAYLVSSQTDPNVQLIGRVNIEQVVQEWNDEQTALVDFTQEKPLIPYVGSLGWENTDVSSGAYRRFTVNNAVDKYVSIKNIGKVDAYVRTFIALEMGDYTYEEFAGAGIGLSVNKANGDEFRFDGAWEWTEDYMAVIDGKKYNVMVAVHTDPIAAGETTIPSLLQVYLSKDATNETVERLDGNGNGTYDVLVFSQAVQAKGFSDATTALTTAFGTEHPWKNGVVIPVFPHQADGDFQIWRENALVSGYQDLQAAVDAAKSGDTIKLSTDVKLTNGATVDNKSITVNGCGHTLDKSALSGAVFTVTESAELHLNDLTIDGGADGFAVDYDNVDADTYVIPLVSGSEKKDPVSDTAAIVSSGTVKAHNVTVTNLFTEGMGGGLIVSGGTAQLTKCIFDHIYSRSGSAVYVGTPITDTNITAYPIKQLAVTDCVFKNNYAYQNGGGAITAYNVEEVIVDSTDFLNNAVSGTSSYGAAIFINYQSDSEYSCVTDACGLPETKLTVRDSLFEGNYAGNDGAAIQMYSGVLNVSNTLFLNNTGINPGGSVGTISFNSYNYNRVTHTIDSCLFQGNTGAVTGIADHGSLVTVNMTDTHFKENSGRYTVLMYYGDLNMDRCTFTDEAVEYCVLDVRSYYTLEQSKAYFGVEQIPTARLKNVTFTGTLSKAGEGNDVWSRKQNGNLNNTASTVILGNNVVADLKLLDNTLAIIDGCYTGTIALDANTPASNVTVTENASGAYTIKSSTTN